MTKFQVDEQFLNVEYKCSLNPINFLSKILTYYYFEMSNTYKQGGSFSLSMLRTLTVYSKQNIL